MPQEYIEIRGARENNLKNVSLRIPKRKITIFTGVSGSGKSSIVFDTIATESQRLLNENFSMFVRNFLPKYSQPDADAIENLSMSIVVDQKRMGGGSHSTVGTVTDINTILRLMFSRIGQPHVGPSNVFGFNDPKGMCPNCNGLGRKLDVDLDKFLDKSKSLNEGAILFPEYAVDGWGWNLIINSGLFDPDKKLSKYTEKEMEALLHSKPMKVKTRFGAKEVNLTFEGIVSRFTNKYIRRDVKTYSGTRRIQNSIGFDVSWLPVEPQLRPSPPLDLAINVQRVEAGIAIHIIRYDYDLERDQVPALEELDLELSLPGNFGSVEVFAPSKSPKAELATISDGLYHLKLENIPLYSII